MKINVAQLKEMSEGELHKTLGELQGELRQLRFLASQAELKQMHKIGTVRKHIARVKTVLGAKRGDQLTNADKAGKVS